MVFKFTAFQKLKQSVLFLSFLGLLLFGEVASAQETAKKRFALSTVEMGVNLNFVVYGDSAPLAEKAIRQAIEQVKKCNAIFSDYSQDSEISRLARSASNKPVLVSDTLLEVLERSRDLHQSTAGAFDVTLGSLTLLWRQARREQKKPNPQLLETALSVAGLERLEINASDQTIKIPAGMKFDFGGIVKGFAADLALASLRESGMPNAFVDLGGDIAIGDSPPGKPGWKIAIAPLDKTGPVSRYVTVSNCGVATSGDTEQFVEIDGARYSHILDPRTGLGLQRRASVTVIAGDATQADALASAFSVMPEDEVRRYLKAQKSQASFLLQQRLAGKCVECTGGPFPVIENQR